jgi:dihydrofolate reductase
MPAMPAVPTLYALFPILACVADPVSAALQTEPNWLDSGPTSCRGSSRATSECLPSRAAPASNPDGRRGAALALLHFHLVMDTGRGDGAPNGRPLLRHRGVCIVVGSDDPDVGAWPVSSHTQIATDEPLASNEPLIEAHTERGNMRKLVVSTYATLDGRVDELQEWVIPYNDDASVAYHTELLKNGDGLLLGRKTYEIFATIWPPRSGEFPYIDQINSMPKYVASTTLKDLEWENSQLIEGDVADGVAKLKQQPGQDLVMYGCHDLMHKLLEHDLIDEYRILVHPTLLGRGRTLFEDGARPVNLELIDSAVIASRVAVLTYQPAR